MPKIRVKRSTGGNAPSSLEFGELAFSDGDNKLHIGKQNGSVHTFAETVSGLLNILMPVGSIIWWHKTDATGVSLPSNWAECNGQYLNDAASPFHNKILPNINGQNRFIRGSANSGTPQDDAMQGHAHTAVWRSGDILANGQQFGGGFSRYGISYTGYDESGTWGAGKPITDNTNGTPRTDSETRPKNISMVAIIRIK